MDLVRSALFNILAPWGVEQSMVADLFAGTGSLGIEALSRAAAHADFVEQDARQCADIQANLKATSLEGHATVHLMSVEQAVERLTQQYDFVLMDPPYADPFPAKLVARLVDRALVKPDAVVVVGHSTRVPAPERCDGMVRYQDRRYGDSALAFYVLEQPVASA
jgi:16S rRNA (guanine966-N2)-methyltransferase